MNNTTFTDEFVTNSRVTANIKRSYQTNIDELRMEIRMMERVDKDKLLPYYRKALELILSK
jgi:hypothetical protein